MQRDRSDATQDESHVFDQTNGVVDLGSDESAGPGSHGVGTGKPDDRSVAGIAMLSVKRP